ncbi:hypothetical protein SAMN05444858_1393 [Micromonospora avicenniae]|uniref:Uncharacterized protein n=1 Tax=Micromonospora avicenniae TaxID=1198245 RepID=A0A1N7FK56_9ACTN|nr:hypothetical protein SAMN05444858_1393 [Micromonospora avicenniae]
MPSVSSSEGSCLRVLISCCPGPFGTRVFPWSISAAPVAFPASPAAATASSASMPKGNSSTSGSWSPAFPATAPARSTFTVSSRSGTWIRPCRRAARANRSLWSPAFFWTRCSPSTTGAPWSGTHAGNWSPRPLPKALGRPKPRSSSTSPYLFAPHGSPRTGLGISPEEVDHCVKIGVLLNRRTHEGFPFVRLRASAAGLSPGERQGGLAPDCIARRSGRGCSWPGATEGQGRFGTGDEGERPGAYIRTCGCELRVSHCHRSTVARSRVPEVLRG